jgi:putative PEP-CTERM system TPR-repeat lipoprotein
MIRSSWCSAFRLSLSVLVFALAASMAGCGDAGKVQEFIASGKAFADKSDDAAAIIQFKNALQVAPENPEVRYLLGSALRRLGDLPAAEIELRKAVALGYEGKAARVELIGLLTDLGQPKKALEEIDVAAASGSSPDLEAMRGDALFGLGQTESARTAFEAALRQDPTNAGAQIGMARLAATEGDFAKALKIVEGVLANSPGMVNARFLQANLYTREGKTAEAIAAYDKALESRPGDLRIYAALIPALMLVKDTAGAQARLDTLRKLAPGAPMVSYLDGLLAYASGDRARARTALQNVLKVVPDDLRARLLAGTVEHDLGNYALAEKYLSRVVEAIPTDAQSRLLLASSHLRLGNAVKASETLAPLLTEGAGRPALVLAGDIATARRDAAKAVDAYQRAIALGDDSAVRTKLGQARLASGDVEAGLRDLQSAVTLNPKDGSADLVMVSYFLGKRQPDRARAAVNSLLQRIPDSPVTHHVLGEVLLAEKDTAGARQAFEKALSLSRGFLPAAKQLAELDLRDGKKEAAIARFQGVLAVQPKQVDATLLLARTLQQTGAPGAEVVAAIDQAIAADAAAPAGYLAKIEYYSGIQDRRSALAAAQEALSRFGEDRNILLAAAYAQEAAGDHTQALGTYGKLTSIAPDWAAPFVGQAAVHAAEKNYAAARTALDRALKIEPNHLLARLSVVEVDVKAGKTEQAKAEALEIQKQWPKLSSGYAAEGAVHLARKDLAAAEKAFREGLARTDDRDILRRLYGVLLDQGRAAEADREINTWNSRHPNDLTAMMGAADTRLARKQYKEAEFWYRQAMRTQPENPILLNNLAWVLGQLGDESSIDIARQALAKAPGSAVVQDTLGMLLSKFGKHQDAIAQLKQATERAPTIASIHLNLARAYVKAGNGAEARKAVEAASKLVVGDELRSDIDEVTASIR